MNTVIIGIAGGTASGKTTIAKKVYQETSKQGTVSMIKIDDYYKIFVWNNMCPLTTAFMKELTK